MRASPQRRSCSVRQWTRDERNGPSGIRNEANAQASGRHLSALGGDHLADRGRDGTLVRIRSATPSSVGMNRVAALLRVVEDGSAVDSTGVAHAIADAERMPPSSVPLFTLACAAGASALSIIFGVEHPGGGGDRSQRRVRGAGPPVAGPPRRGRGFPGIRRSPAGGVCRRFGRALADQFGAAPGRGLPGILVPGRTSSTGAWTW